jgi:hypothetical protein
MTCPVGERRNIMDVIKAVGVPEVADRRKKHRGKKR